MLLHAPYLLVTLLAVIIIVILFSCIGAGNLDLAYQLSWYLDA